MAIIKKFRIKSFKEKKPIIKLENISLSFKNRNILDGKYGQFYKCFECGDTQDL